MIKFILFFIFLLDGKVAVLGGIIWKNYMVRIGKLS